MIYLLIVLLILLLINITLNIIILLSVMNYKKSEPLAEIKTPDIIPDEIDRGRVIQVPKNRISPKYHDDNWASAIEREENG